MHIRYELDGRLIYVFEASPDESVWDERWQAKDIQAFLSLEAAVGLGEYTEVFLSALNAEHPVVEAGCGPCRYLEALRKKGFDCIGIDNSLILLKLVKGIKPGLPLLGMDVLNLALANNSVGAYISLGVLEHFPEGMEKPLAEARRVLRQDGLILASTPYFNPHRWRLAKKGRFLRGPVPWERFYQFALREEELKQILSDNGFEPQRTHYLHTAKGIRDEFPFIRNSYTRYRKLAAGNILQRLGARFIRPLFSLLEFWMELGPVKKKYSHMVMVVARKKPDGES